MGKRRRKKKNLEKCEEWEAYAWIFDDFVHCTGISGTAGGYDGPSGQELQRGWGCRGRAADLWLRGGHGGCRGTVSGRRGAFALHDVSGVFSYILAMVAVLVSETQAPA